MEMYPESDTPEFGEIDDDAADEAPAAGRRVGRPPSRQIAESDATVSHDQRRRAEALYERLQKFNIRIVSANGEPWMTQRWAARPARRPG
jgi:hypothetical protein